MLGSAFFLFEYILTFILIMSVIWKKHSVRLYFPSLALTENCNIQYFDQWSTVFREKFISFETLCIPLIILSGFGFGTLQ